jgi:hypothetical protein
MKGTGSRWEFDADPVVLRGSVSRSEARREDPLSISVLMGALSGASRISPNGGALSRTSHEGGQGTAAAS